MLQLEIRVEVILKFQEAHTSALFFEVQEADFLVSIPASTTADAFEDAAIEAISEESILAIKPKARRDADVIGVAVTRIVAIS